jgi:opacity protein-like surface antigen
MSTKIRSKEDMRRSLVVVIMVLTVAGMAAAQDLSKVELFGGYSVLIFASKDVTRLQSTAASVYDPLMNAYYSKIFKKGGIFSAVYNINENIGVEADAEYNVGNLLRADGYNLNEDGTLTKELTKNSRLRVKDFACFIGPRYAFRFNERITPFAHIMVGVNQFGIQPSMVINGVDETNRLGVPSVHDRRLAVKGGAGFDVKVRKNIAVRAFQADVIWANHSLATNPKTDLSFKNVSLSAGVVFHLLKK